MTTQDNTGNKALKGVAHIISDTFSPILMPTVAMAVALWLTVMRFIPLSTRLWSLLGVFAISAVIPFLTIFALIKAGRVSDTSISDRTQRFWPYLTSIICYIGAGLYLKALHAPHWMPAFFYGAACVSVIATVVTSLFRWKISAHVAAVSGVVGIVYWLAYNGMLEAPMFWLSAFVVLAGIVAWSRLYLDRHTPLQVFAGAVVGFAVEYAVLCI